MSYPRDHKPTVYPNKDVLEDERATFGDQAPFANSPAPSNANAAVASPTTPSQVETGSSSSAFSNNNRLPSSPALSTPQPTAPLAQSHSVLGRNPQEAETTPDVAPPSYEEVARSRSPQDPYGNNSPRPSNDPSAPLLQPHQQQQQQHQQRQPSTYASIPIPPPAVPYTPSENGSTRSDSERAGRFNKFWVIFFIVVVLLLITDDETRPGGGGHRGKSCSERAVYHKNLTDFNLAGTIVDFDITGSGVPVDVVFEQGLTETPGAPGTIKGIVEGRGLSREDVVMIRNTFTINLENTLSKVAVTNQVPDRECLSVIVKFVLPPSFRFAENIKVALIEGTATIKLMEENQEAVRINNLDVRVITGDSNVRATVSKSARLGGSVGSIRGDLVIGKEFSVTMVDGHVALNLSPVDGKVMEGKVVVSNGSINVGLPKPYEGEFRLETRNGLLEVLHPDPSRTVITKMEQRLIRGYSSSTGRAPTPPTSELRLEARNGNATLSMKSIDL
ncbi:hypothetical protein BGZ83_006898 [Gryganskiella cystojenkinii]|nr:hypothetical protein BGZ83_006898 [Gryganskiella cystojenkinii]